jgi:hypothetical protein
MRVEVPFEDWVVAVFDPTVEDPWPPPAQELAHLTRLFSDPVGVLEGLSDEEIGVGLWSVLDSGGAGTALALTDVALPLDARIACVAAIRTVYRDLFMPRCGEREGNLLEDAVLDRWLRSGPIRDPRLRTYADAARTGCIQ